MKKKVIVTGGLGFIGSNLVHKLVLKYKVYIVDNFSYSSNLQNLNDINKKKYKICRLDISKKKEFEKILFKINPYGIFHLAAETHVDRSIENANSFISSNIIGTFNILEALKKYYKINKNFKFIYISTDEVFGDIPKNKKSKETDPYLPSSPYSASKASSNHLVSSYYRTFKIPSIITNCSNNYGPRQFPEKLVPKLILNIIENKKLPIYGNGKNQREWIYVNDHNDALIKIFNSGKIGETYNIGSGEILSNKKICELILKICKSKLKTNSKIIYVKDRPGHDKRYALNSTKLKKNLGWKCKNSIFEGLSKTIDWYLENKKWINSLKKKDFSRRIGINK